MPDLEKLIAQWREQMLAAGIKSPALLEELEIHLREEIGRRMLTGLNTPEAFELAVQQIGKAASLKNEFQKISGVSAVLEMIMIGVCLVLVGFILWLSAFTIFTCYATWRERAIGFTAVASILLVACGWRHAVPFLPVIRNKQKRIAAGSTCMLSGFVASTVYCQFVLPYFEVAHEGQPPAMGLWAVFLIAIFACAGMGLSLGERERDNWGMRKSAQKSLSR